MAEVRIRPGSLTVEVWVKQKDQAKLVGALHLPEVDLTNNNITVKKGPGGSWKAKVNKLDVEVDRED